MRKLKMLIELEYDNDIMHADDEDGERWFYEDILMDGAGQGLVLSSNEIGDSIGTVRVLGRVLGLEAS